MADAICGRKDSHIHKHWVNKHKGKKTRFSFRILGFFNSALERQVGEAVRILRTGAERILNSKGEFNRCSLPRITAEDTKEEETLGDMEGREEQEVQGTTETAPGMSKRMLRREKF